MKTTIEQLKEIAEKYGLETTSVEETVIFVKKNGWTDCLQCEKTIEFNIETANRLCNETFKLE